MRQLALNEVQSISGGEGEVLVFLALTTLVIAAAYSASSYGKYTTTCSTIMENQVSHHTESVPLYDPHGNIVAYQDNVIETVTQVPKTVCY